MSPELPVAEPPLHPPRQPKAKRRGRADRATPRAARRTRVSPNEVLAEAGADGDTVVNPAAAMLPTELLQPGEIIILILKPSTWFILLEALPTLVTLAILFALSVAARNWLNGPGARELTIVAVALILMRLFWQFLEWLGRVYVLTDRRMIRVRGVIRVHIFETSLKNIQNTSLYISARERLFGLGTLGFATSGTGPVEVFWRMVAKPREVHQIVVQAVERYR